MALNEYGVKLIGSLQVVLPRRRQPDQDELRARFKRNPAQCSISFGTIDAAFGRGGVHLPSTAQRLP